jgi:hypothetical protein
MKRVAELLDKNPKPNQTDKTSHKYQNNLGKNRLKAAIGTCQHHVMRILKPCEELAIIQARGEIAEDFRQVLSAAVIKPS